MPKKRRKLDVFCQNLECSFFDKKGVKNVIRNGKKSNGVQNYKCTECDVSFVRTKGTMFYHKKLKKKDVIEIVKHSVETNSLRGIARQTNHNKNTICAYVSLIANHCEKVNDILIKDVKLGVNEIDEMWSFVKKNKKKLPKNFSQTLKKETPTRISA